MVPPPRTPPHLPHRSFCYCLVVLAKCGEITQSVPELDSPTLYRTDADDSWTDVRFFGAVANCIEIFGLFFQTWVWKLENLYIKLKLLLSSLSHYLSPARSLSIRMQWWLFKISIFFLFISLLNLDNLVCHLGQGPKDRSASKRDTTNEKLSKRERAAHSLWAGEERVRVRAGAGECVCLHRIHNYTI